MPPLLALLAAVLVRCLRSALPSASCHAAALTVCRRHVCCSFREKGVGATWRSFPEYFKDHGFMSLGSGKLYHPTLPPDNDVPKSWTEGHGYFSPECMPEYAGGLHAPRCESSVPPPAGAACGAPRVPGTGGTCPGRVGH
jgi:hypothetical protein